MTSDHVREPSPRRRRRNLGGARAAASLASLALLGAAPSAAHAAGWTAGPSFSVPPAAFANDFVLSPNGASTAAWYAPTSAGRVTVQRAAPDGALGAPLDLGAGGAPVLATSASNLTAVAWFEIAEPGGSEIRLHLTLLDGNGAKTHDVVLDTLTSDEASNLSADVALDDAGTATVVWTLTDSDSGDVEVLADRVAPGGSRAGTATLGTTADDVSSGGSFTPGAPAVAAAPGGTTWIAWRTPDQAIDVTRWPAGGAPDAAGTKVSAADDAATLFSITASSAGAAIAWLVPSGETGTGDIRGTRLTASGTLAGAPFEATGALDMSQASGALPGLATGPDVAIGPDGVVTLGWTKVGGGLVGGSSALSRFAPGQATAASTPLSAGASALGAFAPSLDAAADGSILATWLQFEGTTSFSLAGARVAPDGTLGAASAITTAAGGLGQLSLPIGMPRADAHGGGIVGVNTLTQLVSGGGSYSFTFGTYRFDSVGPTVTVDVPTSAVVLTPVTFRGAASENAPLNWDFGDGSTGRGLNVSHVYAGPGVYTVTASASDAAGNETVITRQISITPAQVPDSGRREPTPPALPAAAALKVARAVRSGAKVTVSGTILRSASGKVTVVYAQRVGGATVTVDKTAKIAKGRWSTTLTLPRVLTRGRAARAKGAVTVTFAGTATIKRATVKRSVAFARARRAARKKQRAAKRR